MKTGRIAHAAHGTLVLVMLIIAGCSSHLPAPSPTAEATPQPSPTTEAALQPSPTAEAAPQPSPTGEATPPPLTALQDLGLTGTLIEVDIQSWRLVVDGLVENPLSMSYEELLALPTVTQAPRLECPGFFVDYAEWTGPLVKTILEEAGLKPEASDVWFSDGSEFPYQRSLPLDQALGDDTFVAHTVYGQPLPPQHGYPVRLVAGSRLGSYWVKWLFHIEVR
jgi:DMSO/TMAO reductase YedYZ molybdopterin-dependent catalytic subunit